MDRSNLASEDTWVNLISAGNLLPALTNNTSPGTCWLCISVDFGGSQWEGPRHKHKLTKSAANRVAWEPFLMTWHSSGSMFLILAMTRPEDQSCHMLKPAWIKKTANSTMASARFACAGGSPSGFQATKTRIEATSKMDPKPLKKYPM